MSDQADLNKVLEDVLLSTFEDHNPDEQAGTQQSDLDKKYENEEEIDFDKQLVDILGEVDSHSKENNHSNDVGKNADEDEYEIDFANVVQGIMDQYGEEEDQILDNQDPVPSQTEKGDDKLHELMNQEFPLVPTLEESQLETKIVDEDEDDESHFQNILAQLLTEAVDNVKLHEGDEKEEIEPVTETPVEKSVETLVPPLENKEHEEKVAEQVVEQTNETDHEKELQQIVADALLANNFDKNLETNVKEVPKQSVPEPVPVETTVIPEKKLSIQELEKTSENFLSELEQLAGTSDKTEELQAALAQMVRNVVDVNESDEESETDDSLSEDDKSFNVDDDGLLIDQSLMNEILHNAFQLAMNQQSSDNEQQKDSNLNQHKAALDDAISSIFHGERPKPKLVPAKKEPVSRKLADKPKAQTAEPLKLKKTPAKRAPKLTADASKSVTLKTPLKPLAKVAEDKSKAVDSNLDSGTLKAKKSKLSIAETLALTRSSMKTAPRRDYSNIESLEQASKIDDKQPQQPGVSTFQSTAAKKSTLAEAIQQMSNALQSSTTPVKLALKGKSLQSFSGDKLQGNNQSGTDKSSTAQTQQLALGQLLASSLSTAIGGSKDNEQGLLDALLLAKQFMSQLSDKESAAGALDVINNAIDSLKKPEATTSKNTTFRNATSSSMTAAITQAISDFAGSMTSTRSKTSYIKKTKMSLDAPELKEKIRQSNRERKKKWREINAERNKDNDLRFRVAKRASQLFGDTDSEEKSKWINVELEKRRKRRLERSSHSLKPFENYVSHNNNFQSSKPSPSPDPVKAESSTPTSMNSSLIKTIMDSFRQTNLDPTMASAMAKSAVLAFKSSGSDQQQMTEAIKNAINSFANNAKLQQNNTVNQKTTPSFKVRTLNDFAKDQPNALNELKTKLQDVNMTNNGKSDLLKVTLPQTLPQTPLSVQPNNAGIANSMQNLTLTNSLNNFTTTKSPQLEKRQSDDTLMSEELKKPRSVSPPAQINKLIRVTTSSKDEPQSRVDTTAAPQGQSSIPRLNNTPSLTRPLMKVEISRKPSITYQQQQQQTPPLIVEPFKNLWSSSRTAFRLPQYKKPGSDYERYSAMSPQPANPSTVQSPSPVLSKTTPAASPSPNTANTTPRRPLQRPGFSKPSTFQRPRW